MKTLWKRLLRARIWRDTRGQDFIEYDLLVASLSVTAGATFPTAVTQHVSMVFSKVKSDALAPASPLFSPADARSTR